jgi:hypothetical protein
METSIKYLADHPDSVAVLARWLFDEWGHHSPDGKVEGMIEGLNGRLNRDRLPLALVGICDGQPVGMESLKLKEVEIRSQYEHWLGTRTCKSPTEAEGLVRCLSKLQSKQWPGSASASCICTPASQRPKDCTPGSDGWSSRDQSIGTIQL